MKITEPIARNAEHLLKIYAGLDHDPERYEIWLEGQERCVTRERGESAAALWARVLATVAEMRCAMRRGAYPGRCHAWAHVHAGNAVTEALKREWWRELLVFGLLRLADERKTGSGVRLRALRLAASMVDPVPPAPPGIGVEVQRLPTKEELDRAIVARRGAEVPSSTC